MFKKIITILNGIIRKTLFCVLERRLPFRSLRKVSLVNPKWYRELEQQLKITSKIKVGFGPVISGEDDLHVRKWRIDPIVNRINEISEKYCAGIFLTVSDMAKFDIVVMVREIEEINFFMIDNLKQNHKKLIYDIVDRPYLKGYALDYEKLYVFLRQVDALIASNPLQIEELNGIIKNIFFIEHPLLNRLRKDYTKANNRRIRLIWQGFAENQKHMRMIHPIIKRLIEELKKEIHIIYLTNLLPNKNDFVKFKTWTVRNWERALIESDIAVENKVLDDPLLRRKPATKIVSYMAAGLPVVCTPSAADKLVIEHGRTGFFAYTEEDWYYYLKTLILDGELRRRIGEAAREYVINNFNIHTITQKYLDCFDRII
jgi:glycosyltransferase involved in cell wall biosynthesis